MSQNPSTTIEFAQKHSDFFTPNDWTCISLNKHIPPKRFIKDSLVKKNPLHGIGSNPRFTPKIIEKYPWVLKVIGFGDLHRNPSITPEFIEKHIEEFGKAYVTVVEALDIPRAAKDVFYDLAEEIPVEELPELFKQLVDALSEQMAIQSDPEYISRMLKIDMQLVNDLEGLVAKQS